MTFKTYCHKCTERTVHTSVLQTLSDGVAIYENTCTVCHTKKEKREPMYQYTERLKQFEPH